MTVSFRLIRLVLLSGFLGAAVLGSTQSASAFSFKPGKVFKSVGKAAGSVAKGVGKAAGGAAKAVGKTANSVGRDVGRGVKTAANGAKKPLRAVGENALLATPAAPAILAKRTVDTARHGPRASTYLPSPVRR